jgi:hypothetical protein
LKQAVHQTKDLDLKQVVASMRVGVLTVFEALMVKKEVLDTGDSGELIILIRAEAKQVAAYEVEALLKVHSILASTLKELKVLKHFHQEAPQEIPMGHSPVDRETGYSENLAFEAHIELPGN